MKIKYLLALILSFLFYTHDSICQVNLNKGLIAYYPFNGNANDASGNGLNGIPQNGVQLTTDKFGNPNSAYYFDGVDDYIEVLDDPKLRFRDSFSVCLLFNRDPTGNQTAELIEKRLWADGSASSFDFGLVNTAQVRTSVKTGDNCPDPLNGWVYPTVSNSTLTDQWYCVVTTFNQGLVNFYLDGVLIGSSTTAPRIDSCVGSSMRIGIHLSFGYLPFKGKIDEVRLYNRAINQQEVNALCVLCNQPQGSLSGDSICSGAAGVLTYNSTIGTAPFTVQYSDGTNTYTQNNVTSGVPFTVTNNPVNTTTYTLVSVTDATGCSRTIGFVSGNTQIVISSCNPEIVTAGFIAPDSVCVNSTINISNNSINASNYYWNFCTANIDQKPIGTNLGNPGGLLNTPVYIDYVLTNGNYYGFVTNNAPGGLVRLDFGNSLLNTPVATSLGTVGGAIPNNTEGVQIASDKGSWYLLIVGGDVTAGSVPSLTTVSLGTNIANNSPTATNWGNIGNLSYPHDLYVFNDNGHWYGLTVNFSNNTFTRFDLTTSLSNTPSAINLGNIGNLNGPSGIQAINDNGNWRVFVTNALSSTLTRLDFGPSLLNNSPTGVNLGNPNNAFVTCWDIYVLKYCGENLGFVINANGSYDIVKLDFGSSLTNTPTATSLGNQGNLDFPHCLSKLFRVGPDVYSFITNVNSNSVSLLKFQGCTASNTPNSTLQNPPTLTYNVPGIYNINLTVDDGLPTQSSFCKQIVVLDCCPPLAGTLTGNTICVGGTFSSLTFSTIDSTGPFILKYTNGVDTFTSTNIKSNIPFILPSQPNVTTKYILLSIKDTTSCPPTIIAGDTAIVIVNPSPKGYLSGDDICTGDNAILLFTSTSGAPLFNISYSANGNAYTNIGIDNNSTFTVPFQLNSSTNFTLTSIADANGCTASLDTSTSINVLPLPQGGLTNATACTGDSAGIVFIADNGTGPFEVEISDGINTTIYYDVLSSVPFNIAPVTGIITISLVSITDKDGDGCTRTSGFTSPTATITAMPSPEIEFDPLTAICIQQSAFLITQAKETTGLAGNGIFSGEGVDANGNFSPSAAGIGSHQIIYTYNATNGCSSSDSSNITVNPTPAVNAGPDIITCIGFTVQLNATGASTYVWSPTVGLDNPAIKNPIASVDSTTTYTVFGTDSSGCFASDTVTINVGKNGIAAFMVPNAFTPNGDGVNDCFGIRRWGEITVVEFDIFNRWGELVFTTKNPSDCWDGTYKGKLQPTGGYPYVIKAKTPCGDMTRTGIVILAR